ncbi:hypothetical protein BZG29_07595 [Janthinobacterium sp. LM6]|uniref:SUMF1/EgtB/PvdO family nonheme iron enzyme n=1 Tax=Janthinobacterium sp. LM6 TaxID=1938606 RepID=UPI000983F919|nr:SUMF1/EgtB/PvdO family nonheme iron enzyme [Janthinobacterium sp. LM6]AQR68237.1 hypothetical protein BZG29_07595 [Janthinobacterium sp. LM6]
MNTENLLRAMRKVYLLTPKPGLSASEDEMFWSMCLNGLHEEDIRKSVTSLRQDREMRGVAVSKSKSLKVTDLQKALAVTLGARSYDHWCKTEQPRILGFLAENGMNQPADLIKWPCLPGFTKTLTAHRLADRFFNSGLPLPKRLFTGVGSLLFAASGYGRLDIHELAGKNMYADEERLEYCELYANEVVLRANDMRTQWPNAPEFVDLTGRMLLLNAVSEFVGGMYNLLGDNLMAPMLEATVFTAYNVSEKEAAFDRKLFQIFRAEIERSEDGWVDVIPLPGNDNIIFLRGADGKFDWVIRNQRDTPFIENFLFPVFNSNELPSALLNSKLAAHLYFRQGEWQDRLMHDAEQRHYAEGGSVATWPGYDKLLARELMAERGYIPSRQLDAQQTKGFLPHRIRNRCLMISPLITVDEFWKFYENSEWRQIRSERLRKIKLTIEEDLAAVNLHDHGNLPVSVTWFDAIAYCRYVEDKTGLPVRLLEIDEWQQICPNPARDLEKDGWGDLTWGLTGGDGLTGGGYFEACPEGGSLRFGKELAWSLNREGLQFLSVVDFGEWLADYGLGHAPAANAATGRALMTGPLERDKCPAHLTMRYKGLKVGFRICYVAQLDA